MAELTQDQFEQLPDFVRDDYEQKGDIYRPKAEGKAEALKASLNSLDSKSKGFEQQIAELQGQQEQAIEQAKQQALADAKTSGDVASVEKKYQEMLEDLKGRHASELESLKSDYSALENMNKNSKRDAMLADIRGKLSVFEDSSKAFDRLVAPMIDIDAKTGNATFLDDAGSATSLDMAGFMSQLENDPAFGRMRQAKPTGSGGVANGSNSTGGASNNSRESKIAEINKRLSAG